MSDAELPIRPMDVAGNRLTLLARRARAAGGADRADRGRDGIAARPLLYLGGRRGRPAGARRPGGGGASAASRCRCSSTASAPRNAKEGFFRPLVEAKARFCRFVPRWGRRYLLRNHQKLALADGRRAIVGGFNISNDYFGTIEDGAWRDLGLEVDGPSVEFLVRYFDALFTWAETPDASIRRLRRTVPAAASATARSTGCSAGRRGGSAPGRARSRTT